MQKVHGPEGIRVWQGYRNETYLNNRADFVNKLGALVLPITMQTKEPVGLLGYFTSLLPNSDFTLPDQIALELYESPESCTQANHTTTSVNSYQVIQNDSFNFCQDGDIPVSKFNLPIAYENTINFGQAYYLLNNEINWRDNKTNIFCAKRPPHISPTEMQTHIQQVIPSWLAKNSNVNGSILVCEKDYVLYWEHSTSWDSGLSANSLFSLFSEVLNKPLIAGKPLLRSVPPLNAQDHPGLKIEESSSVDIRVICTKFNPATPIFGRKLAV